MASRDELNAKRELARKRHRAATQKVSRIKAKEGITLSGTKNDPRKEPASFKRMNAKQLDAHIARLDSFISRDVQFVKGAAKTKPLSGNLWQTYKRLESAVNKKNAGAFEEIKDLFIPTLGVTASEAVAQTPDHPVTGNPSARAPHIKLDRKAAGIPNDRQLKKLIADMQKKLGADYTDKMLVRDRRVMGKFLRDISKTHKSEDLKFIKEQFKRPKEGEEFKGLTPGQFSFLWNYTNFSDAASFDYEIAKDRMSDKRALAAFDSQFDVQIRHMKKLINDVKAMDL